MLTLMVIYGRLVTWLRFWLGLSTTNTPHRGHFSVVTADFETGNLVQVASVQASYPESLVVVASPVRSGKYALRAVCLESDPPVALHNHRSEVIVGGTVTGEHWYGISIYLPTDWSDTPAGYHLVTQWHTAATGAMQPLQLNIHDDKATWERWDGFSGSAVRTVLHRSLNAPLKGVWTDYVVHAKWTESEYGYIQIWQRGSQIVDFAGRTLTVGGGGCYWKAGCTYTVADTKTVYIDEMRMAGSDGNYITVAPR